MHLYRHALLHTLGYMVHPIAPRLQPVQHVALQKSKRLNQAQGGNDADVTETGGKHKLY